MTAANQSYWALNGQFIPSKPGTNYVLILYNFYMILLTIWQTMNFISDLKTIKFESNILGQFLHTVLSLKTRIKKK